MVRSSGSQRKPGRGLSYRFWKERDPADSLVWGVVPQDWERRSVVLFYPPQLEGPCFRSPRKLLQ